MDTSGEYIEMCSKLPSGIRERVPRDHQGCMGGDKSFFGYHKKLNGMVWLPRQDQLQGMLDLKPHSFGKSYKMNIGRTNDKWTMYCQDDPLHYSFDQMSESMEQLWLAFVMSEKYGKAWNGKEWI